MRRRNYTCIAPGSCGDQRRRRRPARTLRPQQRAQQHSSSLPRRAGGAGVDVPAVGGHVSRHPGGDGQAARSNLLARRRRPTDLKGRAARAARCRTPGRRRPARAQRRSRSACPGSRSLHRHHMVVYQRRASRISINYYGGRICCLPLLAAAHLPWSDGWEEIGFVLGGCAAARAFGGCSLLAGSGFQKVIQHLSARRAGVTSTFWTGRTRGRPHRQDISEAPCRAGGGDPRGIVPPTWSSPRRAHGNRP